RLSCPCQRMYTYVRIFFFQSSRHHPDLPSFPTRRSSDLVPWRPIVTYPPRAAVRSVRNLTAPACTKLLACPKRARRPVCSRPPRSEEHTSELQSLRHLVCRLLLEKKKNTQSNNRLLYQHH